MPKTVITTDKLGLSSVPLPTHGGKYTPVGHKFIIDEVIQCLEDNNLTLIKEEYKKNLNGEIAQGVYHLQYGSDPDLGLMFAWSNSYDKTMSFRCAVGSFIKLNNSCMIGGDMSSYGRRHVGDADDQVKNHISSQLSMAANYFQILVNHKEYMKTVELTDAQIAELLGSLFIHENLITSSQLIQIKSEIEKPSYTYTTGEKNLWTIYNHILVSLKKSHPKAWLDGQKKIHSLIKDKYFPAPVEVDPNQLDLMEEAAKAEEVSAPGFIDEIDQTKTEEVAESLSLESYLGVEPVTVEETLDIEEEAVEEVVTDVQEEVETEVEEQIDSMSLEGYLNDVPHESEIQENNSEEVEQSESTSEGIQQSNIDESFPTPPADIPSYKGGSEGTVGEDQSKELLDTYDGMEFNPELESVQIEKDHFMITKEQEATPLEEQVAGSTVQPVTEEEKSVSKDPIINEEDEKKSEDFDFDFGNEDVNTELGGDMESPFQF